MLRNILDNLGDLCAKYKYMNPDKTESLPVVSVIVVTYNQEVNKLLRTLDSIINQEGISFEIIICDDGSDKKYEEELKNYFSLKKFNNYELVFHKKNEGTVSNYYSGLIIAKGNYSKLISPGDYLVGTHTLEKWVRFLEKQNAEWSFSDTYFYYGNNEKMTFFRALAMPQIIRPYITYDKSKCIWNYTVLNDVAHGASIIGKTDTQMYFCKIIKDKGIKYCEDHIYHLMMFYGIVGHYYSEATVCYECGVGISSTNATEWQRIKAEDISKLRQIMFEEKNKTNQQKKIVRALIWENNTGKIAKIYIRGKLLLWLKRRYRPRLTQLYEE